MEFPFRRRRAQKADTVGDGPANLQLGGLKPLILENGNKISKIMQTMNLPVKRSAGTLNTQITQDLNQGQYNLLLIDHDLGHDTVLKILETTTQIPPYATAVVIDGPIEMMNLGATDCVPAPEFSLSRVGSAVINGNRWKDLQLHLNGSDNHLLAKDPLTSLPGRTRFKKLLEQSTRKAREDDTYISLITLDLDSFKALNESKGHAYGDLILKTVAERLTQFVPEHSIVGRLGDDEFAVIIQGAGLARVSDTTTAARLSHELRQPYFLDGQSTTLSATMGIAKLEEHDTPDSLLHKAMSALYSAKRDKNRFMVYTQQEDTERRQQLRLAQELPDAIDNNQLRLHFQPMIRMHDSTVIGAEALVRWQHPQKGLLFPDSFIPLAEGAGSIEPLTRWVLDAAIRQGSKWLSSGHKLNVSVNISALILHNPIFPDIVNRLLEQSRFPAERLKLEITESAIISDVVRATDVVTRLHELGVKVSIDDFGTGYTSLAYIRKLPVDEIKIDKSFVLNMNTVSDDAVIVRTLLELARNLDLSVVAEGVEDRETWYMLAGLGCHVAQGYYMSRPIDVEAFDSWLTTSPWAAAR